MRETGREKGEGSTNSDHNNWEDLDNGSSSPQRPSSVRFCTPPSHLRRCVNAVSADTAAEIDADSNNADSLQAPLLSPTLAPLADGHPRRSSLIDNDDDPQDAPPATTQQSVLSTAAICQRLRQRLSFPSLDPPPLDRFVSDDSLRQARRMISRSGNYVAYGTLGTMMIVVPLVLYHALSNRKLDLAAFHSARVMVLGTIVLSCRLVYLHLTHWYMPDVQKYVVRILWMVPIYAVQSWLSLIFHESRLYFGTLRDFYEAYVIASFVYYLIELLGGQTSVVHILRRKARTEPDLGHHTFPLHYMLQDWELGVEFLLQCKHGVLQYVVFKVLSTVITFVCVFAGVYGEGKFEWLVAYPYLAFLQNISVMYALYCLVMLYHAVNDELREPVNWRPLGKFLCIKGVVFATWWQGVLIFYLRAQGFIGKLGPWSSEDVANGLIDYCIVVEMIGFAIAHSFTFSYKEYLPSNLPADYLQSLEQRTPSPTTDNLLSESNYEEEESGSLSPDHGGSQRHASSCQTASKRRYRPPATLPEPMPFRDAFWESTLPTETLDDIRGLRRNGFGGEWQNGTDDDDSDAADGIDARARRRRRRRRRHQRLSLQQQHLADMEEAQSRDTTVASISDANPDGSTSGLA